MDQILTTKFYIPTIRPDLVHRSRLVKHLNRGLHRKLTLLSAPAGFGKTTLLAEWFLALGSDGERSNPSGYKIAWLSLDEQDNDLVRFLTYLINAIIQINGVDPNFSKAAMGMLQSPQLPSADIILTPLINLIAEFEGKVILVLDDYHLIDHQAVHEVLTFLLNNIPPQMHLVIATREDPQLPLSRLRARDQVTEVRAADLRFTIAEAAEFLNQVMGLELAEDDIAALENRTEGWIAGLQLVAISLHGEVDASAQIQSFTGSHRLILDYLIEEVLNQQPEEIKQFLLKTSILKRMTGPLCDAVTGQADGQNILENLERANLFIISLDNERHWYRYHHLFADLLRQQLLRSLEMSEDGQASGMAKLHIRASEWFEVNHLEIEAFEHAAAAHDVPRAERLIEGGGLPVSFRGIVTPVLNWLATLSKVELDARPSLWVTYAMSELTSGKTSRVEEKLRAAEAALENMEDSEATRDLSGRIASIRANLAVGHQQLETIISQSQRALEYLHPDNLTFRTATTWKMGVAYEFQGDRFAASQAFHEAISISQAAGNIYTQALAMTGLGNVQMSQNQLYQAEETYQKVLVLVGDLPIPVSVHINLCLAKIYYQWDKLEQVERYAQQCLKEAGPYRDHYDIFTACQVEIARLMLARGDMDGAVGILKQAEQSVKKHNFINQAPQVASVRVLTLLRNDEYLAASELARKYNLPLSQARVLLAQANPSAALSILRSLSQQAKDKDWRDEYLKVNVLMAVALQANGNRSTARQRLADSVVLAEPGGLIRLFVDEGPAMAKLLGEVLSRGVAPDYIQRLLESFHPNQVSTSKPPAFQSDQTDLVEPLSEREIEVLQLIAEGLTNQEIATRLFLSLNTIKVHTRNIFGKLGVSSRTKAVAKARILGVLPPG